MAKPDWTEQMIIDLIEENRLQEILWNPKDPNFHNNLKKSDAWNFLGVLFHCNGADIKKKIDSILSSFRRERQKCIPRSGDGLESVHNSKWFAYKHLMFLLDKYKPRNTIDSAFSNVESVEVSNEYTEKEMPDEVELNLSKSVGSEKVIKPVTFRKTNAPNEKKRKVEDPRINEAYSILKDTVANSSTRNERDESSVFGEYVANKHRKYDANTKVILEHKINNILFEADMGKLEIFTPRSSYVLSPEVSISSRPPSASSFTIITPVPSPHILPPSTSPDTIATPLSSPQEFDFPQTSQSSRYRATSTYKIVTTLPSSQYNESNSEYANVADFINNFNDN